MTRLHLPSTITRMSPSPNTSSSTSTITPLLPLIVMAMVLMFSGSTIGLIGKVIVVIVGNVAWTAQLYGRQIGGTVSWARYLWETFLWCLFWLALVFSSTVSAWIGFGLGIALLLGHIAKVVRSAHETGLVPPAAP